jgi:predicted phosphodiesterase
MRLTRPLLAGGVLWLIGALPAPAQHSVSAAWTQIGPGGSLSARIVTRGRCPSLQIDGTAVPSRERAAPGRNFDVRTCEAAVPPTARRLSLLGRPLPLPPQRLRTVAFLGDTGCRIEIVFFQACKDPDKWPFPKIARLIAAAKPDLIVHLGDYYYRETPCLVPACAGSPHGDNWAAWAADFFEPAAAMLARAPLLAVRGNHEDCGRGGRGWDRFLSVYPFGRCLTHEPAYAARVGGFRFFVLDSSAALDARPRRSLLPALRGDFARLRRLRPAPTWLLTHRPMWALDGTLTGGTLGINRTLEAAEGDPKTLPIGLALSGHIHLFEALRFADGRPPQVVVGTGGDTLGNLPSRVAGWPIDGTRVAQGVVRHGFGFALFHLDADRFDVFDRTGKRVYACTYGRGTLGCRPA